MRFDVFELRISSILYLYSRRSTISIDPEYQRMGGVWTLDKRQLLIDSIINEPLMHDDPVTPDVALEGLME